MKSVDFGLTSQTGEGRLKSVDYIPVHGTSTAIVQILGSIFQRVLVDVNANDKVRLRLNSRHLKTPI